MGIINYTKNEHWIMSAWLRSLRFPWKLQSIKLKRDIGVDLFSSVIRMFLFFPSRSFTVKFIHYKYFCFTINIQRAMTSFYTFFCLVCFRTTIKRNNCYNKQKSCHFRVYLFKSTTFSETEYFNPEPSFSLEYIFEKTGGGTGVHH